MVQVLTLAIAPAVGLGIARFAYALVLPDMRADLGWSWAEAGWMNTTNALGYLAGALLAARAIVRLGAARTMVTGAAACVASLGLCALLHDTVPLNLARVLAGLGGGLAFVAGGVLAASVAADDAKMSGFLLGLYYAGPGVGIALSGLMVPAVLHHAGPGSWALAWGALTAVSAPLVLILARGVRTNAGAALPVVLDSAVILFASAVLFGGAFFAVVASTTAFVRRNVQRTDWGRSIGTLTAGFGIGQMLGPIVAGAINDRTNGLTSGLAASALLLLLGAVIGAAQRDRPAHQNST